MDNRHVCPECNKPYKHLLTHLQNKHEWDVEDIFNYDPKAKELDARKNSEIELEVESTVARSVDKSVMMHALSDMNSAIRSMYDQIDESMTNTVIEAGKIYRRSGEDEIDGPRTDVTRVVREILQPSSERLRECIIHELCRISNELKVNVVMNI